MKQKKLIVVDKKVLDNPVMGKTYEMCEVQEIENLYYCKKCKVNLHWEEKCDCYFKTKKKKPNRVFVEKKGVKKK